MSMEYQWMQREAKTRLSAAEAGHFIKTMVGADGAAWTASQALKEDQEEIY